MSEFSLLCDNVNLWDLSNKATWGSLNFCPRLRCFVTHALTHNQLTTLSEAGGWGGIEKPHQDLAFLLIALSADMGGEQIFGLAVVWVHPHQGCLTS